MNPTDGLGRNLTEIAAALLSIAFIAMLVSNAGGVTKIIESAGSTFSGLIGSATLSNGYGSPFNSF